MGGAQVYCPICGKAFVILAPFTNHTTNPEGDVQPSVVCPHDGCTFHEFVTLDSTPKEV